MEKILNQKHDSTTFFYAFSRMFERAGYYGLRSILILYIMDESTLGLTQSTALTIYTWLGTAIVLATIIGALLGDFLIGNKKSIMIGSIVQAAGAFCLIIPSEYALYAGLLAVAIGSGLYVPNLLAHFGKSYLNRYQLLDAAFTGLYAIVNIGALIGTLFITIVADKMGFEYGFALSGIIMLLALVFPLLANDKELVAQVPPPPRNIDTGQRFVRVLGVILVGAIFWAIYELNASEIYSSKQKFSLLFSGTFLSGIEQYLIELITIPLTIIALLIWSNLYARTSLKVLVGVGFTTVAIIALSTMQFESSFAGLFVYTIAMTLLAIGEICIAPLVFSTITKYTDPRYLAVVMSLAFIPGRIFNALVSLLYSDFYGTQVNKYVGMVLLASLIIGVVIYFVITKDGKFLSQHPSESELDSIGTES